MHKDTRALTVAQDHLQNAYDELGTAQGQSERSAAEAAAQRALAELNLVVKRLEHERHVEHEDEIEDAVERAYTAAHAAWQSVHDMLNDWDKRHQLGDTRSRVMTALQAVRDACTANTGEAIMP